MKIGFPSNFLPECCTADIKGKPRHADACGHKPIDYIGSFSLLERYTTGELAEVWYDVYLYPDSVYGLQVCIRASAEPSDYATPGSPLQLLYTYARHSEREYGGALKVLLEGGVFDYTKTEQSVKGRGAMGHRRHTLVNHKTF